MTYCVIWRGGGGVYLLVHGVHFTTLIVTIGSSKQVDLVTGTYLLVLLTLSSNGCSSPPPHSTLP